SSPGEKGASQQVIAAIEIRIPAQRRPDLVDGFGVTPIGEIHPRLGALDLRRVVASCARLLRRGTGAIDPLLMALKVVIVLGADLSEPGMREREIRIEGDRVLIHL